MTKELFFKQLNDLLKTDSNKDAILCSIASFDEYLKPAAKMDKKGYYWITLENDRKILVWSTIYLPFNSPNGKIDMMFFSHNDMLKLYDKSLKPFTKPEFKDELSTISELYSQKPFVRSAVPPGLRFIPGKDINDQTS